MQIQLYDITSGLKPYVKLICTMECDKDEDTSHIRVLPDACVEIFLNYTNSPVAIIDDQLYKRSIASFRMNQYVDVQMRKGSGCVAVCFYPGMAHRFFKYPMDVLANTTTPLNDLWGFAIEELEAQLAECSSRVLKVNILQQFLLRQLMSSKEDPVISSMHKAGSVFKWRSVRSRIKQQGEIKPAPAFQEVPANRRTVT